MPKPTPKWSDHHPVTAYRMACGGMTDQQIARTIFKVSPRTFVSWQDKYPSLKQALLEAREKVLSKPDMEVRHPAPSLKEFLYRRLSPKLRKIWHAVHKARMSRAANGRLRKLEFAQNYLDFCSRRELQRLFLQALHSTHFSVTESLYLLGLSRETFEGWVRGDEGFKEMVGEIELAKDDFFETALIRRVEIGDTAAVLFVARSRLKHRGYAQNSSVDVNVTQRGTVDHRVSVESLPLALQKQILKALREEEEQLALPEAPIKAEIISDVEEDDE